MRTNRPEHSEGRVRSRVFVRKSIQCALRPARRPQAAPDRGSAAAETVRGGHRRHGDVRPVPALSHVRPERRRVPRPERVPAGVRAAHRVRAVFVRVRHARLRRGPGGRYRRPRRRVPGGHEPGPGPPVHGQDRAAAGPRRRRVVRTGRGPAAVPPVPAVPGPRGHAAPVPRPGRQQRPAVRDAGGRRVRPVDSVPVGVQSVRRAARPPGRRARLAVPGDGARQPPVLRRVLRARVRRLPVLLVLRRRRRHVPGVAGLGRGRPVPGTVHRVRRRRTRTAAVGRPQPGGLVRTVRLRPPPPPAVRGPSTGSRYRRQMVPHHRVRFKTALGIGRLRRTLVFPR